jgi:hypothetical protein
MSLLTIFIQILNLNRIIFNFIFDIHFKFDYMYVQLKKFNIVIHTNI